MAKKDNVGVDCVMAGTGGLRTVSNYSRCAICGQRFKATDAAVRVRNHTTLDETDIHRRCMLQLLEGSVEDATVAANKFEAYRAKVAENLGIELV